MRSLSGLSSASTTGTVQEPLELQPEALTAEAVEQEVDGVVGVHEVVHDGVGEAGRGLLGVGAGKPVVTLVEQHDHHGGREQQEGEGHHQEHHGDVGAGCSLLSGPRRLRPPSIAAVAVQLLTADDGDAFRGAWDAVHAFVHSLARAEPAAGEICARRVDITLDRVPFDPHSHVGHLGAFAPALSPGELLAELPGDSHLPDDEDVEYEQRQERDEAVDGRVDRRVNLLHEEVHVGVRMAALERIVRVPRGPHAPGEKDLEVEGEGEEAHSRDGLHGRARRAQPLGFEREPDHDEAIYRHG